MKKKLKISIQKLAKALICEKCKHKDSGQCKAEEVEIADVCYEFVELHFKCRLT